MSLHRRILLGLGLACLLGLLAVSAVTYYLWRELGPQLPRLPPRAPESAEQKRKAIRDAFTGESSAEDNVEYDPVRELFDTLGEALRQEDVDQVQSCLDVDRLWQEVNRSGQLTDFGKLLEKQWLQSLRETFAAQPVQVAGAFGWERLDVRGLDRIDDDEMVVTTRRWYHTPERRSTKMRWWLRRHGGGWRVFDVEYLGVGYRWSDNLARGVGAWNFVQDPTRVWYWTLEVGECLVIGSEDLVKVAMNRLDVSPAPPAWRAQRCLARGGLEYSEKNYSAALGQFEQA